MSKFTIFALCFIVLACGSNTEVPDLFFPKQVANFAKSTFETNDKTEPLKELDSANDHVLYEYKHKIFIILDLKTGTVHQIHPKLKAANTTTETTNQETFTLASDSFGQPPLLFDGIHCVASTDKEALFLLKCNKEPLYQYAIRYTFEKENLISKKVFQMGVKDLQTWGNLTNWPTSWPKPKDFK